MNGVFLNPFRLLFSFRNPAIQERGDGRTSRSGVFSSFRADAANKRSILVQIVEIEASSEANASEERTRANSLDGRWEIFIQSGAPQTVATGKRLHADLHKVAVQLHVICNLVASKECPVVYNRKV